MHWPLQLLPVSLFFCLRPKILCNTILLIYIYGNWLAYFWCKKTKLASLWRVFFLCVCVCVTFCGLKAKGTYSVAVHYSCLRYWEMILSFGIGYLLKQINETLDSQKFSKLVQKIKFFWYLNHYDFFSFTFNTQTEHWKQHQWMHFQLMYI